MVDNFLYCFSEDFPDLLNKGWNFHISQQYMVKQCGGQHFLSLLDFSSGLISFFSYLYAIYYLSEVVPRTVKRWPHLSSSALYLSCIMHWKQSWTSTGWINGYKKLHTMGKLSNHKSAPNVGLFKVLSIRWDIVCGLISPTYIPEDGSSVLSNTGCTSPIQQLPWSSTFWICHH